MNTLIKFVITTVIGLFGTLTEVNDSQVDYYAGQPTNIENCNFQKNQIGFYIYDENSYEMLKYKCDS